jgi:hypothetical protein
MSQEEFKVVPLPEAEASLRVLATKAKDRGLLDQFREEVLSLKQRLREDPLEVGELVQTRGNILIHAAGTKLLGLRFAIDLRAKVVSINRCWPATAGVLAD